MDRLACIDLPALPLQLLRRAHPEWAGHPLAVVAEDRPQGEILWADARARAAGVRPGLRYAAALACAPDLRAAVVPEGQVAAAVTACAGVLRRFTPTVEPAAAEPGVVWADASGLERLFGAPAAWGRAVHDALATDGFVARVVVGFTRFGTYALARGGGESREGEAERRRGGEPRARLSTLNAQLSTSLPPVMVLPDPGTETTAARGVALARLAVPPDALEALEALGVRTVGALADLPGEGLRRRFGEPVAHLHRAARGGIEVPLRPLLPLPALRRRIELSGPTAGLLPLLRVARALLEPLLVEAAARGEAVAAVALAFAGEDGPVHAGEVRPATPSLDLASLLGLVQCHLEGVRLSAPVLEATCTATGATAAPEQLVLFAERAGRERRAAERALARVRAEFGPEAVVRAVLREAHLPEAQFGWEAMERMPEAEPEPARTTFRVPRSAERSATASATATGDGERAWGADGRGGEAERRRGGEPGAGVGADLSTLDSQLSTSPADPTDVLRPLVRRIHATPLPLPPPHPDGEWHLASPDTAPVTRLLGPYLVSGGWWARPVRRAYHFAETRSGLVWWVFYDEERGRWYLQGEIE